MGQPVEIAWANLFKEITTKLDHRSQRRISRSGICRDGISVLCYYDYFRSVLGVDCGPWFDPFAALTKNCSWWWPLDGQLVLSEKPIRVETNEAGSLHNDSGPAIEYRDQWCLYAWHGIRVPKNVAMRPEQLTVDMINTETNDEMSRIMLHRYGEQRYLSDVGATVVDEFSGHTLLKAEVANGERVVILKVVNASPEPDGSRREYYLRVSPDIENARDALEWTLSSWQDGYHPSFES